jgi:hypothetical protein
MMLTPVRVAQEDFHVTTLAQIQSVLSTTPPRWQQLTATLPEDLLTRAPAPGEWSAVECLRHMTDAEQSLWPVRVQALLTGNAFPPFSPNGNMPDYMALSPIQLADEFARLRAANLPLLATITASDLARTGMHPQLGKVTLEQLLHVWAGHDLMHTVQAERALMQPFIAGTGPWRGVFFTDHDVAPVPAVQDVTGK